MGDGNKYLVYILAFISLSMYAQNNHIDLSFGAKYGDSSFCLSDSTFRPDEESKLEIGHLKFYISNVRFLKDNQVVLKEENRCHLIDISIKNPFLISIDNSQKLVFNELRFELGIDSTTNVSGAMGGDLDPTKGMYWAWQSGYINFKLEGRSKLSTARNNEFQFHLGGYHSPFNCLKTISFPVNSSPSKMDVNFDVKSFLNQINLSELDHIMSPSQEAMRLSEKAAQSFSINRM